jgi:hypothetical protein
MSACRLQTSEPFPYRKVACALGPQASSPMYVVLPDCSYCARAVQIAGRTYETDPTLGYRGLGRLAFLQQ